MLGGSDLNHVLTVSAPKQRMKGPRISEIRPKRVEAWLSALPQANAEDSLQQILQALFVQNRTQLGPDNRLSLMEMYHEPVLNIVSTLSKPYGNTSFPLSERQSTLAVSAQRLCMELANGYKIVANDFILHDNVRRNRAEFVLAVQRSTDVLSRVMMYAYGIYRPCPDGVWRELHQLYRIAETHDIVNFPVEDISREWPGEGVSMFDSYQRILLIGALTPYGLMQGDVERLFRLIPKWSSRAHISRYSGKPKKHGVGYFLVNLLADSAPLPVIKVSMADLRQGNEDSMRLLNTLGVVREVHALLTGSAPAADGEKAPVVKRSDIPDAGLLRRFGRILGGVNLVRRSTRTPCDQTIPLCVGMNATHFFASGQLRFDPERGLRGTPQGPGQEYFDLTNPDVGNQHELKPSLAESPEEWRTGTFYRLFSCRVKNQSATGLCMSVAATTELLVRVGDLVGLQFPTPDRWRVGTIRWMRTGADNALDVGIQMLAPNLEPVAIKRNVKEGEGAQYVQALLLPGSTALKQPESLLLPRGTYHPGETLLLKRPGDRPRVATPLNVLDQTGSYDQVMIKPLQ